MKRTQRKYKRLRTRRNLDLHHGLVPIHLARGTCVMGGDGTGPCACGLLRDENDYASLDLAAAKQAYAIWRERMRADPALGRTDLRPYFAEVLFDGMLFYDDDAPQWSSRQRSTAASIRRALHGAAAAQERDE